MVKGIPIGKWIFATECGDSSFTEIIRIDFTDGFDISKIPFNSNNILKKDGYVFIYDNYYEKYTYYYLFKDGLFLTGFKNNVFFGDKQYEAVLRKFINEKCVYGNFNNKQY